MSEVIECNRGSKNPVTGVRAALYKLALFRENPRYFRPEGIWVFTGPQGCGKTLSAVQCVKTMKDRYPYARVVSNIAVAGIDYEPFTGYDMLGQVDNGTDGVIFLLDELHLLWNSLESKNIPMSEMASFCQMRKARRVIIGTSQIYGRIAKPIREQLKYVFICRNYLGVLQSNVIGDPTMSIEREGRVEPAQVGISWFFHSPELYSSYETLAKVERPDRFTKLKSNPLGEVILPRGNASYESLY